MCLSGQKVSCFWTKRRFNHGPAVTGASTAGGHCVKPRGSGATRGFGPFKSATPLYADRHGFLTANHAKHAKGAPASGPAGGVERRTPIRHFWFGSRRVGGAPASITPRAIALVKHLLLERQFQVRRAKPLVLQHAGLVERLAAQHFVPALFIQAFGLGRLVLERLQIHRPRQRRRPAAGLIALAPWSNAGCSRKFVHGRYSTGRGAMRHDGIRLQQAGKKIG